jgi:hypothetical protein
MPALPVGRLDARRRAAHVSKAQLDRALIDREMLDDRRFITFSRTREAAMLTQLGSTTQIPASMFPSA